MRRIRATRAPDAGGVDLDASLLWPTTSSVLKKDAPGAIFAANPLESLPFASGWSAAPLPGP